MKRCFVALGLPEPTRSALAAVRDELIALKGRGARRVRPTRPANMHVTLKFLGATPETILPSLDESLRRVAATQAPFTATLAGLGAFPSPMRPRIIHAAVARGSEAVALLAAAVEGACEPHGFEPDTRDRIPHVTLARIDGAQPDGPLTDLIERHRRAITPFGAVSTEQLILFESTLTPTGPIYTPLTTLDLAATPPIPPSTL